VKVADLNILHSQKLNNIIFDLTKTGREEEFVFGLWDGEIRFVIIKNNQILINESEIYLKD
jgi:hypothetical protein